MPPSRLNYYKRIFAAYLTNKKSHLTFWHGEPQVNQSLKVDRLGQYYMPFLNKADYPGQLDENGIPLLDYHGTIGLQYNPIAVAQYGLGNYNRYARTGDPERRQRFLGVADWLAANLEQNQAGLWMWMHHFDWDYRDTLQAPWYSGLAQGQGISVLVRAYQETEDSRYLEAAEQSFQAFLACVDDGGAIYWDEKGDLWIEEYIVSPPTHILNGFMWASWGVYDYYLATGSQRAKEIFDQAVDTLEGNLARYDLGFWSLYEQSGTFLPMLASPFYHHLHVVQLEIMAHLTEGETFQAYARRWQTYRKNAFYRALALGFKALFKFFYY
jgi:hypothetical protein